MSIEGQNVTGAAVLGKATDERPAEWVKLLCKYWNVPTDATGCGTGRTGGDRQEGDTHEKRDQVPD